MSVSVDTQAEIAKLSRLLQVSEKKLKYLEVIPPTALHELRDQVADLMFDPEASGLHHLVGLTRMLPASLVATITEKSLPPLLTARISGIVELDQAIAVTRRLPIAYMAEVAANMDPRTAQEVVGGMPKATIVQVAAELANRSDFVTLGSMATHVDEEVLSGCFDLIDDHVLLRIAFVFENKSILNATIELMEDDKLINVLRAGSKQSLWPEALDLASHLDKTQHARVANLVASDDQGLLESLIDATYREHLWSAVLPLLVGMTAENLERVAELPQIAEPHLLDDALKAATEENLWSELLLLATEMANLAPLASAMARTDEETFAGFVGAFSKKKNASRVRKILERMPRKSRTQLRKRAEKSALSDQLAPISDLLAD